MTTEMNNTNKLREFVDELKRLNVDVVRPDINKCYADFKTSNNKILYGLAAIKNVGGEAVSNVVLEREKNGKFKSIYDFIKRVDPKDINKLQLEGLVKSGAFDELEKNRKSIFEFIPKLIQMNKLLYDDRVSNQSNLFEAESNTIDEKLVISNSNKWEKKELLSEEFKSLGFYISDHPLNIYKKIFSQLNIKSYREFFSNNLNEGSVGGTLMTIQEKKRKRNALCYSEIQR